jgi:hypothetical protein
MSAVRRKSTKILTPRGTAGAMKARPAKKPAAAKIPAHEYVRVGAYFIWQSKGCPAGKDLENWLEAEAQFRL